MKKSKNNKKNSVKIATKNIKNIHFSKIAIIIFVAICFFTCFFGFAFKSQIEKLLNANSQIESSQNQIDDNGLTIHFINVGQGDCIAIKFPDNKTMLIDAGPTAGISNMINYLDNTFFKDREMVFDYLLLTHSDTDHCGGMEKICEKYQINKIFRPMIFYDYNGEIETTDVSSPKYCDNASYYKTIKAFGNETENVVFTNLSNCNGTEKIEGEGYSFDFYSPKTTKSSVAYNDFSPIMVLNYNHKKIMFTGDATTSGTENDVLNTLPDVDILKVGHHGSKYSSSANFLSVTLPEIAVIQSGNKYGHPNQETLDRLKNIDAKVYRNDKNGNVVANIESGTNAQINVYIDFSGGENVVKVEYIICGVVVLSAYFCFGIKPKKQTKFKK